MNKILNFLEDVGITLIILLLIILIVPTFLVCIALITPIAIVALIIDSLRKDY